MGPGGFKLVKSLRGPMGWGAPDFDVFFLFQNKCLAKKIFIYLNFFSLFKFLLHFFDFAGMGPGGLGIEKIWGVI